MKIFRSIRGGILLAAMTLVGVTGCASKSNNTASDSASVGEAGGATKSLVCYFSATGTTADAANRLAKISGGDIYEIKPVERYTDADLDWRDTTSRSYVEMHDLKSRPAIVDYVPDLGQYDIVYIGYPNWWNTHPTIINTFIESADLSGKTIVPFMTSGGSDIVNSEKQLSETYPTLTFAKGMLMNHVSDEEIQAWVDGIKKQ